LSSLKQKWPLRILTLSLPCCLIGCASYLYANPSGSYLNGIRRSRRLPVGDLVQLPDRISLRPARMTCEGKIDLGYVTNVLRDALLKSHCFRSLKVDDSEAQYEIRPTVVNLTDIFDNVVHVNIQLIETGTGVKLYEQTLMGPAFTQKKSIKYIARALPTIASKMADVIIKWKLLHSA